jgi:uncharacterized FAD-dependent dehydrogenase
LRIIAERQRPTSDKAEPFDVVVVGLGPSGMLASHEFIGTGARALLIDRSAAIGGAAFATDVNLQNITGFPPQSDFGARTLGSRELADRLVLEAYEALHGYGLPHKRPDPIDMYSYAVDEITLARVVSCFRGRVESSATVQLRMQTVLNRINPGARRRWRLSLSDADRAYEVETDHVILATGKLSAIWLTDFLTHMGITYRHRSTFALGLRVEELAARVNPASGGRENPKIRVKNDGVITETFCWCKNGAVMAYDFGGAKLLDGEHFFANPQVNSSFGVITTVELPEASSNTVASVAFSRYISALGEGNVLLQRLDDFRRNRRSTREAVAGNSVRPSLCEFTPCNVRSYYPSVVVDGFLALIAEINCQTPGAIGEDALIYAPILERIYPDIALSESLETNREGIFLVGDCSGKGVGVAPAAAMGLAASRRVMSQWSARAAAARLEEETRGP